MSHISSKMIDRFQGDKVILLSLDRDGLKALLLFLDSISDTRDGIFVLPPSKEEYRIEINEKEEKIIFQGNVIVWKITQEKLTEITNKLRAMEQNPAPCHHYVDIDGPTDTLVLSVEEGVAGEDNVKN
jgi:hypothetical protein